MDGLFRVTCPVELLVLEPVLATTLPCHLPEGDLEEQAGSRVCDSLLPRWPSWSAEYGLGDFSPGTLEGGFLKPGSLLDSLQSHLLAVFDPAASCLVASG